MLLLTAAVAALATWIVEVISAAGYAGVALLMAVESACLPLPPEIIMPLAGYLAYTGRLGLALAVTAGAFGCNLGSAVAISAGTSGPASPRTNQGPGVSTSAAFNLRPATFSVPQRA